MKPINLWSALVALEGHQRRRPDESPRYPEVTQDDLCELGTASRFNMQELTIQAVPGGWLLEVFPADGVGVTKVLVPRDPREPVKVLEDRAGRISHHHD